MPVTVLDLQAWKAEGRRFAMLTAYDYTTARLLDEAGIPVLLVGDSAANTMLGHPTTLPITLDELIVLARAVSRGAQNALLVGDLPFGSYQASAEDALRASARFLKEAGLHAVKLEGGEEQAATVRRLTESGIPVMGHVGLTPQSVHAMGGFKVQGRDRAGRSGSPPVPRPLPRRAPLPSSSRAFRPTWRAASPKPCRCLPSASGRAPPATARCLSSTTCWD